MSRQRLSSGRTMIRRHRLSGPQRGGISVVIPHTCGNSRQKGEILLWTDDAADRETLEEALRLCALEERLRELDENVHRCGNCSQKGMRLLDVPELRDDGDETLLNFTELLLPTHVQH